MTPTLPSCILGRRAISFFVVGCLVDQARGSVRQCSENRTTVESIFLSFKQRFCFVSFDSVSLSPPCPFNHLNTFDLLLSRSFSSPPSSSLSHNAEQQQKDFRETLKEQGITKEALQPPGECCCSSKFFRGGQALADSNFCT